MPGIVGIIGDRPATEREALVGSMLRSMDYEQFYAMGAYSTADMRVYAGWISHESSVAANQPFVNETEDVVLLFSGECFIDREVQTELVHKGHRLAKNGADWLVHLYEEEGDQFFERLNGLFSGLLIDKRQEKVFLFNDRFGSERIYWHRNGDGFYFASEAKALLRVLPHLREFDPAGVAQFCAFGCTFNWQTLFRDIHLLPGGSIYSFENGNCEKRQYFDVQDWESLPTLPSELFESRFEETFRRILPRYFESDLNTGISLTGGLDTRMIVACRPETLEPPAAYTFTGPTGTTLDDRIAGQVAAECHLSHHLVRLGDDFFTGFADHADETVLITDGCFGITGAHEVYFNRQARALAPVRITGLFGSEILRGASTFKPIGLSLSLFDPEFAEKVHDAAGELTGELHPVSAAGFRNIPWNLFGSLAAARSQMIVRTPYLDNEIVSLAYQASAIMRSSPRTALRVIAHNNKALASIPTDRRIENKEGQLAARLERLPIEASFKLDYLYNEGMPHWLVRFDGVLRRINSRVKLFGHHKYLHYRSWFRSELAEYVRESLRDRAVQETSLWDTKFIRHMAEAHIRGDRNYTSEINAVLTLAAVDRVLFREMPSSNDFEPQITANRDAARELPTSPP